MWMRDEDRPRKPIAKRSNYRGQIKILNILFMLESRRSMGLIWRRRKYYISWQLAERREMNSTGYKGDIRCDTNIRTKLGCIVRCLLLMWAEAKMQTVRSCSKRCNSNAQERGDGDAWKMRCWWQELEEERWHEWPFNNEAGVQRQDGESCFS